MNSFTNSILSLLLGWLRTLLNAARDFITSDSGAVFFDFFRHNWRVLFLVLCLGGFALDILVYLIRWRPSPIWIRRRARRAQPGPQPPGQDAAPDYDADAPAIPTNEYASVQDDYEFDAAPTRQYQLPSQQYGQPSFEAPPVYPSYATPQYAPEATQSGFAEETAPPLWDDSPMEQPFAPAADHQNRFAFGMAPSFGSAQSEPAYTYQRETAPSFAPPQFTREEYPPEPYAPPSYYDPPAELYEDAPQPSYQEPSPYFRPFSDRDNTMYSPPKARGFGAVAKKARSLLNSGEAYQSLSYQDLQPTVDVSKAFHAPVYPEKKSEGDQ